jgi:hypothetical protein
MDAISRRASSLFITVPALALGVPLLVTALVYKQRDLSILMLLVLCVAGGAKLWTTFGHRGTQCRTGADKKMVFPGNRIELTLTLTNTTFLPLWVRADVPLNGLRPAPGEDETHLTGESGLWHDSGRFQWDVTAPRRGVFRPGPIGLTCGDIFGFFPKESEVDDPLEIIVYPRLVPLKTFSMIRRDFFGIPGDFSPVRDPVYILGTHDYQHGRPARFIHWKASARRRVLQEKVFEPTEQEKVLFVGDLVEDPIPYLDYERLDLYIRTLERILVIPAEYLVSGHSGLVKHDLIRSNIRYITQVMNNEPVDTSTFGEYASVHQINLNTLIMFRYEKIARDILAENYDFSDFWSFPPDLAGISTEELKLMMDQYLGSLKRSLGQ